MYLHALSMSCQLAGKRLACRTYVYTCAAVRTSVLLVDLQLAYRPLPGYAILGFLLWKQVTCDLLVGKTARQRLSFSMFLFVLKTTFSFVTHLLLLFVGKKISDTCRVRRWRRMASDAASIVSEGPVQPMKPLGLPDALSVLAHGLAKGSANSADEIADLNKSLLALRVAQLKSIAKHLNVRLTGASKKSENRGEVDGDVTDRRHAEGRRIGLSVCFP